MSRQLNVQPTLALLFNKGDKAKRFLEKQLTVTRASKGTRVNRFGLIEEVPENELRLDYDPVSGECLGVLIEEERTNEIEKSEDFQNAYWSNSRTSVVTGSVDRPNGELNADLLRQDNGETISGGVYKSISVTIGTVYTLSVFAKAGTKDFLKLGTATLNNAFAWFDLATGNVGTINSNIDYAKIEDLPNGWYRCSITFTSDVTDSKNQFIYLGDTDGSNVATGDLSGIWIWGAQFEEGSFPTSYIPTNGSTVTRAADNISIEGQDFLDFYNQNEGTFVVEGNWNNGSQLNQNNRPFVEVSDRTNNNRILIYNRVGTAGGTFITNNSTSQILASGISSTSDFIKYSVSLSQAGIKTYIKGNLITDDATVDVPDGLTELAIGSFYTGLSSSRLNGYIKSLIYFPKALDDDILQLKTKQSIL